MQPRPAPRLCAGPQKKGIVMKRFAWAALAASAAALAVPAFAQDGWVQLGARNVTDRVDRDTIGVPGRQWFRQVKLCVYGHVVRFYDVDVRFANGTSQRLGVRDLIPAGGCTRNIDLRGRARNIQAIDFTYEAASIGPGRAEVRAFAR
jgi:hypothetical protein